MYNIWQDGGIRTRVAAAASVLPMSYTYPCDCELNTSLNMSICECTYVHMYRQRNKVTLGWFNKNGEKTGRVLGVGGGFIKEIKTRSAGSPKKVLHAMYDCGFFF